MVILAILKKIIPLVTPNMQTHHRLYNIYPINSYRFVRGKMRAEQLECSVSLLEYHL